MAKIYIALLYSLFSACAYASITYSIDSGVVFDSLLNVASIRVDMKEDLYVAPISDACPVFAGPTDQQLSVNYITIKDFVSRHNITYGGVAIPVNDDNSMLAIVNSIPDGNPLAYLKMMLKPPFSMFPRVFTCQDSCDYTSNGSACGQPTDKLRFINSDPVWSSYFYYDISTEPCVCANIATYCDTTTYNWIKLEPGVPITVVQSAASQRFRFFADSLDGYAITYTPEAGTDVNFEVLEAPPAVGYISGFGHHEEPDYVSLVSGVKTYLWWTSPIYASQALGGLAQIHMCPTDHFIYYDSSNKLGHNAEINALSGFNNTVLLYPRSFSPVGTRYAISTCYIATQCIYTITLTKRDPSVYVNRATFQPQCPSFTGLPTGHLKCIEDGSVEYQHWILRPQIRATPTMSRAGLKNYYTFLPDANVCTGENPMFLLEYSLVSSARDFITLTFSFNDPFPNPSNVTSYYYSDIGTLSLGVSRTLSIPCGQQPPGPIYIALNTLSMPLTAEYRAVLFRLSFKTLWGALPTLVPILSLPPLYFTQALQSSVELHCGGSVVRPCAGSLIRNLQQFIPQCTRNFQPVYPTKEEAVKFYPPNTRGYHADTRAWPTFPIDRFTALDQTYHLTYILEGDSNFTNYVEMNATNFETCSLFFTGQLLTKNYLPALPPVPQLSDFTYPMEEQETQCDPDKLSAATATVAATLQSLSNITYEDFGEVSLRIHLSTVSLFDPAILQCSEYMSSIATLKSNVALTLTSSCVDGNQSDPCCSNELRYSECCVERPIDVDYPDWYMQSNSSCYDTDCAASLLSNYGQSINPTRCPALPAVEVYLVDKVDWWASCVKQVFGTEDLRFGGKCFGDDDCPTGYTCDSFFWTCIGNGTQYYDDSFLQCFVENCPAEIISQLVSADVLSTEDNDLIAANLMSAYTSEQCASDTSFDIQFMNNVQLYMYCQSFPCGSHYRSASSVYEWVKHFPTGFSSSGCEDTIFCGGETRTMREKPTTTVDCAQMKRCNTFSQRVGFCSGDPQLSLLRYHEARQCTYSTCAPGAVPKCVFCPTEDSCFDVPYATEANCSSIKYVCTKPGVDQQPTSKPIIVGFSDTPEGCQAPQFLDIQNCFLSDYLLNFGQVKRQLVSAKYCFNGDCSTEASCTAPRNGVCNTWSWFNRYPAVTNVTGGICFLPRQIYEPNGNVVCGILTPPSGVTGAAITTWDASSLGCVAYSSNITQCTTGVQTSGSLVLKGRFLEEPLTQLACEDALNSCPALIRDKLTFQRRAYQFKDEGYCSPCSGGVDTEQPFAWYNHVWVHNGAYAPKWVAPAEVSFASWRPSLDYTALGDAVKNVIVREYVFTSISGINCRAQEPLNYLNALACSCLSNIPQSDNPDDEDLENYCSLQTTLPASRGRLCYAATLELTFYPHHLFLTSTSYRDVGKCVEIDVFTISIYSFHDEFFPGVETAFTLQELKADETPVTDTLLCRNEKLAVVGSLLTGGFRIYWTGAPIYNATLCLQAQTGREHDNLYTRNDFGLYVDGHVLPLGIQITKDELNGYCGQIPQLDPNSTVFLVETIEDWEYPRQKYLRTSAVILISIAAVLYFIVGFFCFLVTALQWSSLLRYLLILSGIHSWWRTVHMATLAATWGTTSSPVLSEPPNFLFISCVIEMIVLFVICLTVSDKAKSRSLAFTLRVMGLSLYLVLLAVLLLAYLLPEGELHIFACYNEIDLGKVLWPPQKILNVTFIVVLSIIAMTLSIVLIYLAQNVEMERRKTAAANEEERLSAVFQCALMFGVTFIIQMAFLLGFNIGELHNCEVRVVILYIFEMLATIVTLVFFLKQLGKNFLSSSSNTTKR